MQKSQGTIQIRSPRPDSKILPTENDQDNNVVIKNADSNLQVVRNQQKAIMAVHIVH